MHISLPVQLYLRSENHKTTCPEAFGPGNCFSDVRIGPQLPAFLLLAHRPNVPNGDCGGSVGVPPQKLRRTGLRLELHSQTTLSNDPRRPVPSTYRPCREAVSWSPSRESWWTNTRSRWEATVGDGATGGARAVRQAHWLHGVNYKKGDYSIPSRRGNTVSIVV